MKGRWIRKEVDGDHKEVNGGDRERIDVSRRKTKDKPTLDGQRA